MSRADDPQAPAFAHAAAVSAAASEITGSRTPARPNAGGAVTLNASSMDAHWSSARGAGDDGAELGGMMHVVPVKLLTHMKIYRFAERKWPDDGVYGGAWWIGTSAYEALTAQADRAGRSLREVAREKLAVLSKWNEMNILVRAEVRQPLSAWSGTPRTARSRVAGRYRYGDVETPDRSITQLYVPGLRDKGPNGRALWSHALHVLGVDELE